MTTAGVCVSRTNETTHADHAGRIERVRDGDTSGMGYPTLGLGRRPALPGHTQRRYCRGGGVVHVDHKPYCNFRRFSFRWQRTDVLSLFSGTPQEVWWYQVANRVAEEATSQVALDSIVCEIVVYVRGSTTVVSHSIRWKFPNSPSEFNPSFQSSSRFRGLICASIGGDASETSLLTATILFAAP